MTWPQRDADAETLKDLVGELLDFGVGRAQGPRGSGIVSAASCTGASHERSEGRSAAP
jgi:hypothetical protein